MDDISVWEAHGTSFGFSSIGVPITHPGLDTFNKTISAWMDERIESKSNMAALAEYGVDMDHPCVRVFAKDEVDANRKFLVASAESFAMHEFFKVYFAHISVILCLISSHRKCRWIRYKAGR